TLDTAWLSTVDFRDHVDGLETAGLDDDDRSRPEVTRRLNAAKTLQPAATRLTKETAKAKAADYIKSLASEVAAAHRPGHQTLVIVNRVERAQGLYKTLRKSKPDTEALLLHARFRPQERRAIEARLRERAWDNNGR